MSTQRRVGIIGYGRLGQFLVQKIQEEPGYDVCFVWNRSQEALNDLPPGLVLDDLRECASRGADLIVEVAHPCITKEYGSLFLSVADYLVGSPTALSDPVVEQSLRSAIKDHCLFLPAGAFWGGQDIKNMADRGTLQALRVSMTKHPSALKLNGHLKEKNKSVGDEAVVLYEGPVRDLCPLAPNNVNTMAVASMAASNLGFDKVVGRLVADPSLVNWHIVEIDAWGPGDMTNNTAFHVHTCRRNPADPGVVTGTATYMSLWSSIKQAYSNRPGIHLC